MDLFAPLVFRQKKYVTLLKKLEIVTAYDLLHHLPTRYLPYETITPIQKASLQTPLTIHGTILSIKNLYTRSKKQIQTCLIKDSSGVLECVWFNQPFLVRTFLEHMSVAVSGEVILERGIHKMVSPEIEPLVEGKQTIHTGRYVPVYPETKGVSSKWLRRYVWNILEEMGQYPDPLPDTIRNSFDLMSFSDALRTIHFPHHPDDTARARHRLAINELVFLQIHALQKREEWQRQTARKPFIVDHYADRIASWMSSLPFPLTHAQKRVVQEITEDCQKHTPMNRLVQGDVGSGKTVVAAYSAYLAWCNGQRTLYMAPTDILATQQFHTLSTLLAPSGIRVGIMTGKKRLKEVNAYDVIVGTHALIAAAQQYQDIGMVIIDEQHRFGVAQRALLKEKGGVAHVLTMTATPIPRSVALTLYGDLALSVIDEMPSSRLPIKTWRVPNAKREAAYRWIDERIDMGEQAFIICPFIETSDTLTVIKAATTEYERLHTSVFPSRRVALLHGKMSSSEKDKLLLEFKHGKWDILVATPVVEVGIDVPNATIIVIEAAERFGLASLHQLRGRVGRGDKQSYCLLFTASDSLQTRERLEAIANTTSGATLAQKDLHLRGAGNIFGVTQSGYTQLKIASFTETDAIALAKRISETLLHKPLSAQFTTFISHLMPRYVSSD